jgi:hypothetical protein
MIAFLHIFVTKFPKIKKKTNQLIGFHKQTDKTKLNQFSQKPAGQLPDFQSKSFAVHDTASHKREAVQGDIAGSQQWQSPPMISVPSK